MSEFAATRPRRYPACPLGPTFKSPPTNSTSESAAMSPSLMACFPSTVLVLDFVSASINGQIMLTNARIAQPISWMNDRPAKQG